MATGTLRSRKPPEYKMFIQTWPHKAVEPSSHSHKQEKQTKTPHDGIFEIQLHIFVTTRLIFTDLEWFWLFHFFCLFFPCRRHYLMRENMKIWFTSTVRRLRKWWHDFVHCVCVCVCVFPLPRVRKNGRMNFLSYFNSFTPFPTTS